MAQLPTDFMPLDPGRIHADDPLEMVYWSVQLGCSTAVLSELVALHGEHVTVVRDALAKESAQSPDAAPGRIRRGSR